MISTSTAASSEIVRKASIVRLFARNAQPFPDGTVTEWDISHEVYRDDNITVLKIRYRVKGAYFWNHVEFGHHGIFSADEIKEMFLTDPRVDDPEHWDPSNSGISFMEEKLRDRLDRIRWGNGTLSDGVKKRRLEQYYATIRLPA